MSFSLVYLVQRFFYRLFDFFHHWYIDGSRAIGHRFISTLSAADRSFAVKITFKHFFEPLYKDYTAIGRIVGIPFRAGRIIIGSAIYLFIALVFALIYIVWVAIPAVVLYYAVRNR